jgi:hypothetical protein
VAATAAAVAEAPREEKEEAPVAATVAAAETAPAIEKPTGPTDEELELLRLEEELATLERQERERKEAEREAAVMDVSSDDLWQVDRLDQSEPEEAGVLRFAEDIAGFRDQGEGRRRRGGGGGSGGGGGGGSGGGARRRGGGGRR